MESREGKEENFCFLCSSRKKKKALECLKSEKLTTGKVVPKNLSRLYRTTELSRIFPHKKTIDGRQETQEEAQKRLDDTLTKTTPDELSKSIST